MKNLLKFCFIISVLLLNACADKSPIACDDPQVIERLPLAINDKLRTMVIERQFRVKRVLNEMEIDIATYSKPLKKSACKGLIHTELKDDREVGFHVLYSYMLMFNEEDKKYDFMSITVHEIKDD